MGIFEEIRKYLPPYLTPGEERKLFDELRGFPANIDDRIYTPQNVKDTQIRQGDGLEDMPLVSLPNNTVREKPVLVVSNTCDINPQNQRATIPRVMYCPILDFESYSYHIKASDRYDTEEAADDYLEYVREQKVSSLFYLPPSPEHGIDESLAVLSRISNCSVEVAYEDGTVAKDRIFSLGLYGFYLLLLKISIHFSRFKEGIHRQV